MRPPLSSLCRRFSRSGLTPLGLTPFVTVCRTSSLPSSWPSSSRRRSRSSSSPSSSACVSFTTLASARVACTAGRSLSPRPSSSRCPTTLSRECSGFAFAGAPLTSFSHLYQTAALSSSCAGSESLPHSLLLVNGADLLLQLDGRLPCVFVVTGLGGFPLADALSRSAYASSRAGYAYAMHMVFEIYYPTFAQGVSSRLRSPFRPALGLTFLASSRRLLLAQRDGCLGPLLDPLLLRHHLQRRRPGAPWSSVLPAGGLSLTFVSFPQPYSQLPYFWRSWMYRCAFSYA